MKILSKSQLCSAEKTHLLQQVGLYTNLTHSKILYKFFLPFKCTRSSFLPSLLTLCLIVEQNIGVESTMGARCGTHTHSLIGKSSRWSFLVYEMCSAHCKLEKSVTGRHANAAAHCWTARRNNGRRNEREPSPRLCTALGNLRARSFHRGFFERGDISQPQTA